jgi:hypothetical protein
MTSYIFRQAGLHTKPQVMNLKLKTFKMKKNMGVIDRVVRILIAAVIVVLYFMHVIPGTPGIILLILAGIFVLTGILGFCPLYLPFGLSTRKKG